jgi:hypothetical protein
MLTRREALRIGSVSLGSYLFTPFNVRASRPVSPLGSARFCIFVMLDGGPSHVDAWDLKEGKWTPPDFDVKEIRPGVKWPMALYPNLAKQMDRFALLRSVEARESVHGSAQYYVQAARALHPALQQEIPPLGALVAMEYAGRRRESDTLPAYVAVNVTQSQAGLLSCGFLPCAYAPFHVDTANYYSKAPALELEHADRMRYGNTMIGDAAIVARNLVEADAGTHFIFLQQSGWDHHKNIYAHSNHYKLSMDLDAALAALLEDLATRKRRDGRSLLDETMVVCMGEFGRTPGDLTFLNGRDHYPHAFTVLAAGGGIKGGQIIGKTDAIGARVLDSGWGMKRSIFMEDLAATVYSALGIDHSKVIRTTPSGREFHYIDPFTSREISVLFG